MAKPSSEESFAFFDTQISRATFPAGEGHFVRTDTVFSNRKHHRRQTQNRAVMRLALKDSKTADMDFRIGCFILALPPLVVSKCAFFDAI